MLTRFIARISFISLTLMGAKFGCGKSSQSLNQGLEEEKSYTRPAMEAYRKNPNTFRGNKDVLETWSRADYIALAVVKQEKPGNWAENSNKLNFLEPNLQRDSAGNAFCVIQRQDLTIVLSVRTGVTSGCTLDLAKMIDVDPIKSGDLDFSGRSDYWVYVLKSERAAQP
jgi:hypothetical protein